MCGFNDDIVHADLHTLLLLHVGEVFKCEGPHGRSPEGICLHDGLQTSSEKDNKRDYLTHTHTHMELKCVDQTLTLPVQGPKDSALFA